MCIEFLVEFSKANAIVFFEVQHYKYEQVVNDIEIVKHMLCEKELSLAVVKKRAA